MDTHNDSGMACEMILNDISHKKMVVGAKQIRKIIPTGRASFVYLAQDADPAITDPIMALCEQNQVAYAWVTSMTALGRACGIDVGAATAAAVE